MTYKELKEIKHKFSAKPFSAKGRKGKTFVLVCASTGCLSEKGGEVFSELKSQTKRLGLERVEVCKTGCFGLCKEGPIVVVYPEGIYYTKVSKLDAKEIAESHLKNGKVVERLLMKGPNGEVYKTKDVVPFYLKQRFVALNNIGVIDPEDINDYIAVEGYEALYQALNEMTPQEIVEIVKKSGLRGRGGAGFSTGQKWEFAMHSESKTKFVICNADEGDPGAFMDRSILEGNPHSVIEAMAIAGRAINASKGIIYVRAEYPLAGERLRKAIKQAKAFGLLGKNIFDSGFNFDITLKYGAGAFVCGEETALIRSCEGGRGEPDLKPPYPAESGYLGEPTIINNVETFANIAGIIRYGADKFRKLGTEGSSGTKVFALTGKIVNTGLVELPMGTTLREIVFDIGGGVPNGKKFKAVQIGGPSGACLTENELDTPIDYDSLKNAGAMMGSGGLIVLDEDTCMVDIAKFFLQFTCDESCGKCTPCRYGNKELYEILQRITDGNAEMSDLDKLESLANYVKDNSLCGLGQTSPNPILSTLKYFRQEYIEHIKNKHCPAGVCKALLHYEIDKQKCIGCGMCERACPVGAIFGGGRNKREIDNKKCIKCGKCYEICPVNAIEKGGKTNGKN